MYVNCVASMNVTAIDPYYCTSNLLFAHFFTQSMEIFMTILREIKIYKTAAANAIYDFDLVTLKKLVLKHKHLNNTSPETEKYEKIATNVTFLLTQLSESMKEYNLPLATQTVSE